jgi:hypothetical protein
MQRMMSTSQRMWGYALTVAFCVQIQAAMNHLRDVANQLDTAEQLLTHEKQVIEEIKRFVVASG